jgi:hypothetical protein
MNARFLLLGDSHAGAIGRAARRAGTPFVGGPMGAGRDFNIDFFERRDGDVAFRKAEAETLYRRFLGDLGAARLAEIGVPLVATFGFSIHFFATTENWDIYRSADGTLTPDFLSSRLFDAIVGAMARDAVAFYAQALALRLRVVAVMPPQRVPVLSDPAVFVAAQEVVRMRVAALGVEIVDVSGLSAAGPGRQKLEFCEADDPLHGNVAFGGLVLEALVGRGV